MRGLAVLAGLIGLGVAAWKTITSNHLGPDDAAVVMTMAFMAAVGAAAIARSSLAWGVAIGVVVVGAELSGMHYTADTVLRNRDDIARAEAEKHPAYSGAKTALDDARAALKAHDITAAATLARKDCGAECRRLMDDTRKSVVADRDRAEAVMAAIPTSRPTALAAFFGVSPATMDLIAAFLKAMGLNVLAAMLIAWGAHAPVRPQAKTKNIAWSEVRAVADAPVVEAEKLAPKPASSVVTLKRRATGRDAARFAAKAIRPASGDPIKMRSVASAYWKWCEREGLSAPDTAETAEQFAQLFMAANIRTEITPDREVVAHGVALTG